MAASARTPGPVAWPEQMITQAEAFALAAGWPLNVREAVDPDNHQPILGHIQLACGQCEGSMGQLRYGYITYNGTLDEMLSMVLRHMVMAHDVSLAGLRKETPGGP